MKSSVTMNRKADAEWGEAGAVHVGRRHFLTAGCAAVLLAAGQRSALAAQAYPAHSVNVVVPYAPGGQGDLFARVLSDPLGKLLKQTVIVENRPGATGMLGTRYIVREKPDGLNLLLGQTGEIAIIPSANKKAGYDPLKDLAPIALVGDSPLVMITSAKSPFKSVQELIALAAGKPKQVAYASSGTATPGHLAAAALALGTRCDMIHVPYKGAGQAMTDVISGQVGFFFSSASAAMGHIKSGSVKALAVASTRRMPALPDVPTIDETVLKGFSYSLWGGYFAPAATPAPIIGQLNRDINELLATPAIRTRFEADGAVVKANTPEQFAEFVRAEALKYRDLLKTTGITIG